VVGATSSEGFLVGFRTGRSVVTLALWCGVDDYDALFARVIDALPISAVVNESHARTMKELKRHGGHGLGFSDLHDEVFQ